MNEAAISPDVHAFLNEHIESYEELQILLLLRAQPELSWSCAEVTEQLAIPAVVAEAALRELSREGLLATLESKGAVGFRYAPRSSVLATSVEKVMHCHDENRVAIMKLVTARAIERLRRGASLFFSKETFPRRKD